MPLRVSFAEQAEAVSKTLGYYRSIWAEDANAAPRFLWNAKMRFGKTFTSYQLAKRLRAKRVLVVTFKPAVEDAWEADLKSHQDFDGWRYLSAQAGGDPAEVPDATFPMVLITGRQLEHWHTGSMTRRSGVLDAIEPGPVVSLHSSTAQRLGLQAGALAQVRSRRGQVALPVRLDDGMPLDTAFIPFAYAEAAANLLTNPALDPVGKIAELKYCAVDVRPAVPLEEPAPV